MQVSPAAALETVFQRILVTRMQGLPIINSNLHVQAVGFQQWENAWLGVMITPWFMNLLFVPQEAQAWQSLALGSTVELTLGEKTYTCLVNDIEEIGRCLTYSLHSPMFGFVDQQHALKVAEQFLLELVQPAATLVTVEEQELTNKQGMLDTPTQKTPDGAATVALDKVLTQPIKRRDLLLGMFKNKL